jgi:UDP-3-O-[3-hydroxymyristoyl] glucosamine N-acyltransferase
MPSFRFNVGFILDWRNSDETLGSHPNVKYIEKLIRDLFEEQAPDVETGIWGFRINEVKEGSLAKQTKHSKSEIISKGGFMTKYCTKCGHQIDKGIICSVCFSKSASSSKKYELVPEGKLFRLKALRSFNDVKAGDLGGLVSGEHNLSHDSDCWIYDSAIVSDYAQVLGNAKVFGTAWVYDNVRVSGNARVSDDVQVYGNALVSGDAWVSGNARVSGDAQVSGSAQVAGSAIVSGDAFVSGDAIVSGRTVLTGDPGETN